METSLKELGIQNQAMSFQEMVNMSREKMKPMVQPPPPPSIPMPNPTIMPDPIPVPTIAQPMRPVSVAPQMPMMQPFGGEMVSAPEAPSAKEATKTKGKFCLDMAQKEMLVLAAIASLLASPTAQDKMGELAYLKDNRFLKAAATGCIVAIVFMVAKKFLL